MWGVFAKFEFKMRFRRISDIVQQLPAWQELTNDGTSPLKIEAKNLTVCDVANEFPGHQPPWYYSVIM